MNVFFLMGPARAVECAQRLPFKPHAGHTLQELEQAWPTKKWDLLLSFGTSVIVPRRILDTPGLCAVNIHGASPAYPGRDPHHWAAYDGAAEYGATLHYMVPAVDQGAIIGVETFPVEKGCPPHRLLAQSNLASMRLYERFMANFLREGPPPATDIKWGPRVTKRADFIELCRIAPDMPEEEFKRRLHATSAPGRQNLYTEIHGRRFRIEAPEGA